VPVNSPNAAYVEHKPKWQRVRDCREGEDAVKKRTTAYLPPLDVHANRPDKYLGYLARATFFNATGRTVAGLAGAIFQKPPKVELPERIKDHAKDITMTGVSAEVFALNVVEEDLTTGRVGILVDLQLGKSTDGRPYWSRYNAEDIVNWSAERRGGDEILTLVVLREDYQEPDAKDRFISKTCDQYRELRLNDAGQYTVTIWRKPEGKADYEPWAPTGADGKPAGPTTLIPQRRGKALDFIPFTFIGPTSTAPAVEKPPLLDLVNVNLAHYRNSADYEHGLHYTGIPLVWIAGAIPATHNPAEPNSPPPQVIAGPDVAIYLEKDGKLGIEQADGETLGALENALKEKKEQMTTLGARMLEPPGAAETATAVLGRAAGDHASIRTIAAAAEEGLTKAAQIHAYWMGVETRPSDAKATVTLNKDVVNAKLKPEEVRVLLEMYIEGAISAETFYHRLQGGEWARDGVSFEDEQKAIAAGRAARAGKDAEDATRKLTDELDAQDKPRPADAGPEQKDAGIALNLNGAQISSAMDIVVQVAEGVLPRESGIAMLETLLGLAPAAAQRMVGTAGTEEHKPPKKTPAAPFGGAPPFPPKPKPDEQNPPAEGEGASA
jgi:hypothetical protein